jgi:hypothetical protein
LPTGDGAIVVSDTRLTNDEARRISKLISRLPELVELERDRNKARSRRKPLPLRFKPVTVGDLIRDGKLLEVHCGNYRPERHLYQSRDTAPAMPSRSLHGCGMGRQNMNTGRC